jgi:uncharacterized protein (TIGR00661 family)
MKIFYAVQATGNGHISRAMEILPHLKQYGEVDLFLSGANSTLQLDAPVKYRSKGVCFFYSNSGSLNYLQTVKKFAPLRVIKEARDLPVEKYDLIINDFECITSLACAIKKIPSVNFGHQASFQSTKVPRPKNNSLFGEFVLNNYARASQYIGLHFKRYDDFILPPVIKKNILLAERMDKGYITVYLPSFSDKVVSNYLSPIKDFQFEVFSKEIKQPIKQNNISFIPVDKDAFNKSLINCHGIITNSGFETPAEALSLGKKLLVIPIKGQYEQLCNATALEEMGIQKINSLDENFSDTFTNWINKKNTIDFSPNYSTEAIISFLMQRCKQKQESAPSANYPEFAFN